VEAERERRVTVSQESDTQTIAARLGSPPTDDGDLGLSSWVSQLDAPGPEASRTRLTAQAGGVAAVVALAAYLCWRVGWTLPAGGSDRRIAWALVAFETLPLFGLVVKTVMLWNIDATAPRPVRAAPNDMRVAVLVPTYNEPVEVIAPTVAAACALEPSHQTWVLDDGDRPWVAEMCEAFGARYLSRPVHDHAKAGNLNHALGLLAADDAAGRGGADIIAVLDCDHVPLPNFLTATLGWFADDEIALVQGPQAFYNTGAFDDDGYSGEQGLFFNVLMPARQHAGVGPFWCGSTALLRVEALRQIDGIATETITEDMHTTIKLIRAGWKTAYHHQTVAVGLAPATAEQYLLQRRRWGMGAMQILMHERLWSAKRWMSWRTFWEYLNGTLWWLEGIATLIAFAVPIAVLASGAETSTARPATFAAAFMAMFGVRLWGARRLMRKQIHWPTAFALRVFRVPVGLACLWWLLSRRALQFEVTPKGGADDRHRGHPPRILIGLTTIDAAVLVYAGAGLAGWVPWQLSARSTIASTAWLVLVGAALLAGIRRIRNMEYATSRRNAHRVAADAIVMVDGIPGALIDVSVGGAAVRLPPGLLPQAGNVEVEFPGAAAIKMEMVTKRDPSSTHEIAALRVANNDWSALDTMSRWLFHTPPGATNLPAGVPIVASTRRV
jgi:cellulose synthase (UDP-forming)